MTHIELGKFDQPCYLNWLTEEKCYKIFIIKWLECSVMARKTWVQSQVKSYQRLKKKKKNVLDASLLNTQHYKVQIKGKVEKSRERSSTLAYTLV